MYSLCEKICEDRLLTAGKAHIGCQINEEIDYYYGSICREVAEYILHERGCSDGLYLLRQSNGDYVLSLCNSDSILHYRIIRFPTGELALNGLETQRFTSIDLLITSVDGLATRPSTPCLRSKGWTLPPTYWGVAASVVKETIIRKTREWGLSDCLLPKLFSTASQPSLNNETIVNELNNMPTYALMQQQNEQSFNTLSDDGSNEKKEIPAWQQHLLDYDRNLIGEVTKSLLLKSLHEIQPWFQHGRLTRLEAEKHLLETGHRDGKFLVRERDENGFALCVSHESTIKHYRIDALPSGEFAIQDGHKFASILALVSHYSIFCDGLWTVLSEPCQRRNNTTLSELTTVRNLNLLNRALNRANVELYPNNYNLQQQATHQLTGNSTSSSSSCSSTGSTNLSNRLNHSSKAKIKDWLISINQRWSQLLSSMQCRPNGTHQLIHDCDSIKYGVVGYSSKVQDSMQLNTALYNYQLYNAAIQAATLAVQATKQQMMNNKCGGLNGIDCGHHLCESLYGQTNKKTGNLVNSAISTAVTKNSNEQETPSLNSCSFNSPLNTTSFSLPQSINDSSTNFRSLLDLNTPLIYLDYNKENQNSLNFRSLNCETNTRQLYGLLTGQGSASAKNVGRPWSNTATLAPKRIANKVSPVSLKNLNKTCNNNNNQSQQTMMTNLAANQTNQINSQANQRNVNKTVNNVNKPTLPTIYESNHYKETDLLPLFNSFTKNALDKPPLPTNPPPTSSYSNKLFNLTSSPSNHHHQPSAVLKNLPTSENEHVLRHGPATENEHHEDDQNLKNHQNEQFIESSNETESEIEFKSNNQENRNESVDMNKSLEEMKFSNEHNNDNQKQMNKYEEEITIYQRPIPLPGRLIKSSSLEDLFKIKVCKLNPLFPRGDLFDQSKTIIFCANPGPLARIKTNISNIDSPNNQVGDVKMSNENSQNDVKASDKKVPDVKNNCSDEITQALVNENDKTVRSVEEMRGDEQEDKNSLNTAIAASFQGFLGDLQACKQHQLALSTFRPLSNTAQSTGITGTLNTSSMTQQATIKQDPSVEQIATMANPFSFTRKKLGSVQLSLNGQQSTNGLNHCNETQLDDRIEQATDITDLLKEFDVCFGDDTSESASDLISFSNENSIDKSDSENHHFKFPLPPPSMLSNTTVNSCPSTNCSATVSTILPNDISNAFQFTNESEHEQQSTNRIDSPHYNETPLAKLLNQTALKQASFGPTTLETCGSQIQLSELDLICFEEDPDKVKNTLRKYKQSPLALDPNFIALRQKLGNGFFGEVFLGEVSVNHNLNSTPLKVAVKVLKSQNVPNHKMDILKEAQTMASLDHKHIVRLIGVCESDPLMIVMELAPIGPLNRYLQENQSRVALDHILVLMRQVAQAMRYLESRHYIHRDFSTVDSLNCESFSRDLRNIKSCSAARNVLLVSEHFVKISDFGMSRALGIGKEYYKARNASKWPLKWYAPECIYYFKFSSKSDIWSYGITLWEAVSYGKKPYEGMDGQKILKLFRENKRLAKPANCPDDIYQMMWSCWQLSPDNRPTFANICDFLTMKLCRPGQRSFNQF